jgi:hypothetical protein
MPCEQRFGSEVFALDYISQNRSVLIQLLSVNEKKKENTIPPS